MTRYDREKLYVEVWKEPVSAVAKRYGVSYNGPLVKTISEKNFVNWLSVEIRLPPWYPYSAATEDRATVRTDLSAAPAET